MKTASMGNREVFFGRMAAWLLLIAAGVTAQAAVCDARHFGAKADGVTKDTAALQKAIDRCSSQGGGTVKLSGGTFLSAPLVLKTGITLEIAAGSTLLGSADHADYPEITELRAKGRQSLLTSDHATNITITGGGTIDGQGQSWWAEARSQKDHGVVGKGEVFRPRLVVLSNSKHIRIENVTVQNSPSWQVVPYYCDDVVIRNVRILADPHSPNTDAIDPFSSSNVVIDHVYADVGDDNIAIKSGLIDSPGPDAPSKNITITDCTFMHGHGLSIGSEIAGGAQHIVARNIHFEGTDQAVRIKANRDRGADVSDIHFSHLDMKNVGTAILISEYYPKVLPPEGETAQPVGRLTPFFHDISIDDVTASGSKVAGVIVGLPESPVKAVTLNNVTIGARKGMTISDARVSMHGVTVNASEGEAITVAPSATVDRK